MRRTRYLLFMLLFAPSSMLLHAQEPAALGERILGALRGGTVGMTARYRFELVDDAGLNRKGLSSTLRTTLGYRTGVVEGFSGYVQFEDVSDLGLAGRHNNGGSGHLANGVTTRPVIADPAVTSLLEGYLRFTRSGVTLTGGRMIVNLDDQRFVGAVGWRQHSQAFDGARIDGEWGRFGASILYLGDVHRIAGNHLEMSSSLVNARYRLGTIGTITGYAYLLDYEAPASAGLSTTTIGGRLSGTPRLNDALTLRYEAQYAIQRDAANNPNRIRADYLHLQAGVNKRDYGVRMGVEQLGGSAEDGQFTTPLATLHAFNGWADKFLGTPVAGLRDLYVQAETPAGPLGAMVVYHDFRAASGGGSYGTELDAQVTYRSSWGQLWGVRAGVYTADGYATDTAKFWAYTQWSF